MNCTYSEQQYYQIKLIFVGNGLKPFLFDVQKLQNIGNYDILKNSILYLFFMKNNSNDDITDVIPQFVLDEVNARGFYLYEWISFGDYFKSIKTHLLIFLEVFSCFFWIIFFIYIYLLLYFESKSNELQFFRLSGFFLFLSILFLIFYISIKGAYLFIKSNIVILTDKYIIIGNKIIKYDNFYKIKFELNIYGSYFSEKLFKNHNSKKRNLQLIRSIKENFGFVLLLSLATWWLWFIVMLLPIILQIIVYLISLFFVIIMWPLFVIILKIILTLFQYRENKINNMFKILKSNSQKISNSKNTLLELIKINTNYSQIEENFIKLKKSTKKTILNINKLEKTIKNSKYKDIFNFSIFYNWITNQIRAPLVEIRSLLTNHFEILQKSITSLEDQIKTTQDNLKWPLELQLQRLKYATASSESRVNELNEMIEKITF